ncbi:adenylate cyclase [Desulfosporosinus sp.]|uniref:adenylate cyclase n=1 Tax=Desulfosporosinus sp. TaxID=157907 RepID=UPI002318CC91|nr:adenylate cyclase [Desulfosporosinus sp.]MCO5386511.1 adenylate cyclase [Desulfosporosinus sp.]MDA8222268.1 adenylate cyclase [Desulfitobacterium hafniense]
MSFMIRTQSDVLKFALPLYDYLSQHGYAEEAKAMAKLVDSCYPQDAQALDAHRRAFKEIRETVHDLPSNYHLALDDALRILSQ